MCTSGSSTRNHKPLMKRIFRLRLLQRRREGISELVIMFERVATILCATVQESCRGCRSRRSAHEAQTHSHQGAIVCTEINYSSLVSNTCIRKPVPKKATPEGSDAEENAPTPTKATRAPKGKQTRSRQAKSNGRKAAPPPPQADSSDENDADEADEVASSLASQRSTPEAQPVVSPSSDDFGGYSD